MRDNPLGKETSYPDSFDPELLVALPRSSNREQLGLSSQLPFIGEDVWQAYELSWLDNNGLPRVAMAKFSFNYDSPFLIESKSFKLFLNSLNQKTFTSKQAVADLLVEHLSHCSGSIVQVELFDLSERLDSITSPSGTCLDNIEIEIKDYQPNADLLIADQAIEAEESLYSDLFKSNCPITNQPDWATVTISYKGKAISHSGLLAYLVSYRQHSDYHENCVEKIFVEILKKCQPQELTVQANFLRRGGLDINPIRSSVGLSKTVLSRFVRQ